MNSEEKPVIVTEQNSRTQNQRAKLLSTSLLSFIASKSIDTAKWIYRNIKGIQPVGPLMKARSKANDALFSTDEDGERFR